MPDRDRRAPAVSVEDLRPEPDIDEDEIKALAEYALALQKAEGSGELAVTFVDASTMRTLNKQYRNIDEPTDVLSFSMLEDGAGFVSPEPVMGNVIICPDCAADVMVCLVHGILHIMGHSHGTDKDEAEMNGILDEIMAGFRKKKA